MGNDMAINGGFDYNSLINNPYLYYAMMGSNVNFKGGTEAVSPQTGVSQSTNILGNEAIPVAPTSQETSKGSSFGETVFTLALLGLGAYGIYKGKKTGWFEKAWKNLTGSAKKEMKNETVLDKLTAIKNGNGELKVMVPNKTTTFAGNKIKNGVNEYGVQGSIAGQRQLFNPQNSIKRSFQIETPADKYTVIIEDGKISKVVSFMNKDSEYLTKLVNAESGSAEADVLAKLTKVMEELGKDAKDVDKSVLKGVTNIRYANKFGDDTLNMVMKSYGEAPTLQSFKTLEQFDRTSDVVKSYVPTASEELVAGQLVNQTGGWFSKKGILIDGVGVLKCEKDIAGVKCYFEGGNLVKIEQGGVSYPSESIGFKDFVKTNEKAIEAFKKDVFVDRVAKRIPNGAIIGTVKN